MKSYKIKITEKFAKTFEVMADSFEDAIITIKQKYKRDEIVIDSTDFQDVTFESVDFPVEFQTLVDEVIEHFYKEEKTRYEKSDKVNADHMFLKLKRLKELNTHW